MATKTNIEANGCIFLWKIENISHCWLKTGERIASPAFIADGLEGTKWSLWLYPFGILYEEYADVYLHREKDCTGPNNLEINYQAGFLDKDGKFLAGITELNRSVDKNHNDLCALEKGEKIFVSEREAFLPEDTLTIQCTLWKKEEMHVKSKLLSARTVFKVNRRSFVWKIGDFSSLKLGVRNKFEDDLLDLDLVLDEGQDFEKNLVIDGASFDKSIKYFSFKTAVINSEGKNEYCRSHEYFAADLRKGILSTSRLFTTKSIKNIKQYLQNDMLSLYCDYVCSTGNVSYQFCSCGIISLNAIKIAVGERKEHCLEREKPQHGPDLLIDMKSMYNDKIFSDTDLCTSTQTFPVHKNILSARSPVFRRMFSNDMEGKNSGRVEIKDLEDDTLHRLILYIYTDTLDDLQMENVCKLYAAADKYEIQSLRRRCSSFLKDNLCPNKACDILVVAYLRHDEDLKSSVQDYILKYDKDVFGSQEWKHFMDTNPKLATEIMYRKVFPC